MKEVEETKIEQEVKPLEKPEILEVSHPEIKTDHVLDMEPPIEPIEATIIEIKP